MLLRLGYLAVSNAFAALRLPPMGDRDKDVEILALRHQVAVRERQLGRQRVHFTAADRAMLAALLHRLPRQTLRRLRLLVRPDTVLRWHRNLIASRHAVPFRPKRPAVSWSLYSLRKDWNAAKDQVAPWWRECSKEAFSTGLDQLARALKNWSDSRKGKRKGKPAGFPRFRSRRKARLSVRFTTGAVRCEVTHAVLPRLGRIKLHERAATGGARILSATVRHERGRRFASFTAEQDIARPAPRLPGAVAGVDLGIKTLAVVAASEGGIAEIANPRHRSRALRKVRRLSRAVSRRQGPDRRTGQKPSNRWHRADAARSKALGKVAGQRRDAVHKLTTGLAAAYGTIVVEDLNVAGMLANRRLARHVADASFGEVRRQLEYKLALSERAYCCTRCGTVLDRDVNAAVNLAKLAGSGPDSNGRGADRKTGPARQVAVKRQPGTANAGQTGTAVPQGTVAA